MSIAGSMKLRSETTSKCSVFSCQNSLKHTYLTRPSVTYYPFPKEKDLINSWKQFCNKPDGDCEDSFVCSDHFMPDDFVYSCGANRNVRVLKSNAVPSVYKAEFKQEEEDPFSMDEESGMSGPGPASKTQICAVDGCTSHARQRAGITYHPKKIILQDIPIEGRESPAKEKFVSLLKEHSIIFDTSIAANIRFRKARAYKSLATAYRKKFGKHITRIQLRRKIDEMTNYIRDKVARNIKSPAARQIRYRKWEDEFIKLLQSKKLLNETVAKEEDTSRAILPFNQNLPRNILKPFLEQNNQIQELAAETNETEKLTNEQLQRLLNLEQLKLVRLQQMQSEKEIERLKLNSIIATTRKK
ncbi:uncharacterized protein LOC119657654 isoform X2 [Hermetia illucens]|uniref:uncharacterized protein LOC119657654 isoform X2 n=1 Tax=Hermetia illucens TaxID=343691 RepID=UPI0018CC0041|nr:uncharacterized protein LOC119657654 isoform X2 [Hermetia illucens]